MPLPSGCDDVYSPVCGCDGKTYGNECEAASASVSVASKGQCAAPPVAVCGGLKGLTCAKGEYCEYGSTCGAGDQTGTCTKLPTVCTEEYAPVCGCNGKTYASACNAQLAGVSVASKGECTTSTVKACGARLGDTCSAGQYCLFSDQAVCGRADATGVCTAKPDGCTTDYNPVCGCDGKRYSNKCDAASKGVSVDPQNLCEGATLGKSCGGLVVGPALTCSPGEYCAYTLDAQCGAADQPGICTKVPTTCGVDISVATVCGCNGKSYTSSCAAAKAGTAVAYTGACQ